MDGATLPSVLFNSSVAILDPYTNKLLETITFENITLNPDLHIGGVAVDPYTGLLSVVVDAANPFATGGRDVSGDNFIIKYDVDARKEKWRLNITAVTQGKYGAFQDVEHDARGFTYIVGTYPGTIMRVDPAGAAVKPWYVPDPLPNTTEVGFTGLAAVPGSDVLLSSDAGKGELYRFDMAAADGEGKPILVPRTTKDNSTAPKLSGTDAVYLPPKYAGSVLLVSENGKGITVLRSKDRTWTTAEHLGTVNNTRPEAAGGFPTATVQIGGEGGESLFIVEEYFGDKFLEGSLAGNRTMFPLVDITADVEKLLTDVA